MSNLILLINKMFRNKSKGMLNDFYYLINKRISHSEDILLCRMISKKYINHNTFTAEYQTEDNKQIEIPVGMHVNVM